MKTIEERAKEYGSKKGDISLSPIYNKALANVYEEAYIAGAKDQKAVDEEEINKLYAIMEQSASVLGIGTKWFNEEARQNAIAELKEKILNYLKSI